MSYLVTCTFDLKAATATDYQNAYSDLQRLGLKKAVVADNGNTVVAPTTMTIGEFNGQSARSVAASLSGQVKSAFAARGFKSEVFVVAGGDWAWAGNRS